ncbi:MAG: helix-turn-helix transcriptional regulator [Bacteroidaceae bacterium]|nr:helix-turn-helix transcriptional regulator [Bacteroidaceae bacterium]
MKGETVKEFLKKSGIPLNKVAEKMGETPQNLQSMLRADDIKTGVLERIAAAINKNLYFFYDDESQNINGDNNTAVQGNGNHIDSSTKEFLALLRKKDEQIDRLISLLERK